MKVLFNIKKLQCQEITSIDSYGVPTYDNTIMKLPGTVSLVLENESTNDPFYADGVAYYTPNGTSSTTGTLENALFTDEVLKAIYGYLEDTNGNLLETDSDVKEMGISFACDSDDGEVYFTYFRVSTSKPGINLTTNAPSATINPQSVNITASPVTLADHTTNVLKACAKKTDTNYATFLSGGIVLPTLPASV